MKLTTRIARRLPFHKLILFESAPDKADNTKAVYDEMVRRGLNKEYCLVWVTTDLPTMKIGRHEYCINTKNQLIQKYIQYTAIAKVSCNRWMPNVRKGQKAFYIPHGSPVKSVKSYYNLPEGIDYVITASESLNYLVSDELMFPIEKCVGLGFPRNDVLVNNRIDLAHCFGHYSKYIAWYPTVRQFKSGRTAGGTNSIPMIHDEKMAERLNQVAMDEDILIILKLHFAQDTTYIKKLNLSNIIIIDDQFLVNHHISSYEMVGATDALISDYSSIILDYMLCNNPIGLILEDIEEYKTSPGLVSAFERYRTACEQIYTEEDFINFLHHVKQNKDLLAEQRRKICSEVNASMDGKTTQRVVDYIIDKIMNHRS